VARFILYVRGQKPDSSAGSGTVEAVALMNDEERSLDSLKGARFGMTG
jgi:hypothetical protein